MSEAIERLINLIHTYEWSEKTLSGQMTIKREATDELAALRARCAELEAALTPFADEAENWGPLADNDDPVVVAAIGDP